MAISRGQGMARRDAGEEASVLRSLGYGEAVSLEGRTSIADLFPKSKRCGVYVLGFKSGEVYGGQAVDVARRFAQHLKNHDDIVRINFKTLPKTHLNEFEQTVIRTLQERGLPTRNITYSSTVAGDTDLDDVMPPEVQEKFTGDVSFNDPGGRRTNDPDVRRKLKSRFDRFLQRRHAKQVIEVLREYVPACVPAFVRTELSFWELSLPPRPAWVNARLSVAWQEVLTAFDEEDGSLWFNFHVAASSLGLFGTGTSSRDAVARALGVEVFDPLYKWGGPDQVRLAVPADKAIELVADRWFREAARLLNLRLMRKSPTPYGKFHCFAFADEVLGARAP